MMRRFVLSLIAFMTAMVMNGQVKQTYLTLNNGVQMPQFGLGVYSIPNGEETYNSVIPGASTPDYIREDIETFDFELTPDEMKRINALECDHRFASY